jgi:hypothetical protein
LGFASPQRIDLKRVTDIVLIENGAVIYWPRTSEQLAHIFGDHTEEEPDRAVSIVEGRIADRFLQ